MWGQRQGRPAVVGPSDGELALLRQARDAAWRTREGWWAAQAGSLGRSLGDVAADPRGQAIEAEAAATARAYRDACRRRWPARRRPADPPTARLPGL
jgi:hypothetical protein